MKTLTCAVATVGFAIAFRGLWILTGPLGDVRLVACGVFTDDHLALVKRPVGEK